MHRGEGGDGRQGVGDSMLLTVVVVETSQLPGGWVFKPISRHLDRKIQA